MNLDQINSAAKEDRDSEEEEEQLEYAKSKFTLNIDFDSSKVQKGVTAVVCQGKYSQALLRIIFNDELVQVGKVEAKEEKSDNILVVVQMDGGNDGLNTVIPFADDLYYNNRPRIGIPTRNHGEDRSPPSA